MSNMLLVLFAMVLLLPAFQVEGQSYRRNTGGASCYGTFFGAAEMWCRLEGHDGFQRYNSPGCNVTCKDETELPLPETVCPPCKTNNENAVRKWKDELNKRKEKLVDAWCSPRKCYC
uniref:Putative ixodes 10 kDa peptide protein n=1 Tax=Ixodes ricinus TaxID=34613 RepID=A0A0K8RK48_IXORI